MSIHHRIVLAVTVALAGWSGGSAWGQVLFNEVGAARGILAYQPADGIGAGLAAADFDADGDVDLFIPNREGVADQLYRNLGDGSFEEVAAQVGVASTDNSRLALWIDYDGDGALDLLVGRDCAGPECLPTSTLRLYRQLGDGQFEDVTEAVGLGMSLNTPGAAQLGGMCAGDLNNDGYLEIYLAFWQGFIYLIRNNGGVSFTDISVSSGVKPAQITDSWMPVMHDFNGDGLQDIFAAIDFDSNKLWLNQGGLSFIDAAASAGVDNAMNDMGVAIGDCDNDGDFDLYVTNIETLGKHNILLENVSVGGTPAFAEISHAAGVESGDWGWGTVFGDFDNDTDLDLAATNGWRNGSYLTDPSRFFLNNGTSPVNFTDISAAAQFNDTEWGSGLVSADFDRDGDLDMAQACLGGVIRILDNQSANSGNFLVVRPRMYSGNTHAVGGVVRVTVGPTTMSRLITAGVSFMGHEPAEAHFGLGAATSVDSLTIQWPDGRVDVLEQVSANQVLTVSPSCAGDANGDGRVDIGDLGLVLGNFGGPGPFGDVDGSGSVDVIDLNAVLGNWGQAC